MLRYFFEVAKAGNLTQAAEALGRSPAAVSMMLKQFEKHLGAPLFETDRKKRLTALGAFVFEEAKRELVHFDETISSIMRFAESGEGQVRVACVSSVASALMPAIVADLHLDNPNVLVTVSDMPTNAILAKIHAETLDVGITNEFQINTFSNIKSVPILADRFGILCQRNSTLGRKETIYWSDVASVPFIANPLCFKINEPVLRQAVAKSRMRVNSVLCQQAFIRAGIGVSIATELACPRLPEDLIFRIPEGNIYQRNANLVWNENHNNSPAVARFCTVLRRVIDELGMTPAGVSKEDGPML